MNSVRFTVFLILLIILMSLTGGLCLAVGIAEAQQTVPDPPGTTGVELSSFTAGWPEPDPRPLIVVLGCIAFAWIVWRIWYERRP